jgi:hypothetical protein
MNDWNIQSRGHACEACGRGFADQEAYHTLLFDEKQGFRRSDICESCWQQQYSDGARDRKGFVSYWHGIHEAPAHAPEAIQKDTAESLLRKLIELNDPHYVPAGYILAVMLERKRLLKIKEQFVRDGRRVFVYEHSKTGDVFTIIDPALQLNQLDEVQRDVAALLEHGLNPPQPQPPAAADNANGAAAEAAPPGPERRPPGLLEGNGNGTPPEAVPPAAEAEPAAAH